MKSHRSALSLVVLLAACGGSTPAATPDAFVPAVDGGTDAAAAPDTGGSTADTGPVADTGPAVDAAVPMDAFVDCSPHTFVVTSDGVSYSFDGGPGNPTLNLCAGVTYMFDMSAVISFHPMGIFSGATLAQAIPAGVTTSYTVPSAPPQPDAYRCTVHGFGGAVAVH